MDDYWHGMKACPFCQGKGLYGKKTCPNCHGTGEVPLSDKSPGFYRGY